MAVRRPRDESLLESYCSQLGTVLDRRNPGLALITARQQATQRMMEAAASDRAKTKFLANMSHELRTPVNGVLGMLELARQTEFGPKQHYYIETARRSAETLLGIINGILDISKIEAGKIELEQSAFELRDIVEEVTESFADVAYGKGLELTCLVPANLPTALVGDSGRLRQILTNLVGNAVKFTEKGEVGVRVQALEVDAGSAYIAFEVTDTGIGIPFDKQQHIFDAFIQADSSTTRRYGGTGLGLSIAKQLCEMMGGTIELTSEPGRGSNFRFTARFGRQKEADRPAEVASPFRGMPIILVKRSTLIHQNLHHQLVSWGIPVSDAESGAAALMELRAAAARGEPFALAILDVALPDMSGFDLARQIKSDPAIAGSRLVLLTARDHAMDEAGDLRRHILGWLTKPVRQSALRDCLAALDGTAEPSPQSAVPAMPPSPEGVAGARVLLVEDNPVNLEVAVGILESFGCKVETATNGVEALDRYAGGEYGLIFMDCQLPGMDGFEATAAIRRQETDPNRHVPIVALTASAIEGDREQCLAAGMDDYLPKPFTAEQMRSVLANWLSISRRNPTDRDQVSTTAIHDPIDARVLNGLAGLQREGRPDIVNRVITLFLESAPLLLTDLEKGAASGDLALLHQASHSLKSASANVGAAQLSARCEGLEAALQTGGIADARSRVQGIVETYRLVESALTARLPAVA